jgi:predicted nucleotidyltransferase
MITPATNIRIWHKNKDAQRFLEAEKHRLEIYSKVKNLLTDFHKKYPQTELYLFGSILMEGKFYAHSDIDIALGNAPADRLELYTQWTWQLGREIDIVMLETCNFAEVIRKKGEKVF